MPITLSVLYALHVLCGIMWFGGALFSLLVLGPAFSTVSGPAMAEVGPRIGAQATKVMPVAAVATMLLGIATAFATGRFSDLSAFVTQAYGITVIAALMLAIATYAWASLVVDKRVHIMQTAPTADKPAAVQRIMQAIAVEQAGFLSILFCMVLLRFGY